MTKDYISFQKNQYELNDYIRISVTEGVLDSLINNEYDYMDALRLLSQQDTLLLTYSYDRVRDRDNIYIHTEYGCYKCGTPGDNLLLLSFRKNDFISHNEAMKNGTNIHTKKGIIVSITVSGNYRIYTDIMDGRTREVKRDDINTKNSTQKIVEIVKENSSSNNEVHELKKTEIGPRFNRVLEIAKDYSVLTHEIELQKALEFGKVAYSSISAVQFERNDRIAYEFKIEGFVDQQIFSIGNVVEIDKPNGNTERAEIIDLNVDDDLGTSIIVLCNNADTGINDFRKQGWLSVSVSSVNKDVQVQAIEKYRNGTAPSKYLSNIIETRTCRGFDNKDMTALENELKAKKYPPTDSQLKAIKEGINSKDMYLVMGPPGTGKTTVILEWVKYFVEKEHKRVLISSQNNKAVDNVLARIGEEKDIDVLRIGSEMKIQEDVHDFIFENKIRDFRKNLNEQTEKNLTSIENLIISWARYRKIALELRNRLIETKAKSNLLKKQIREDLETIYKELIDLKNQQENLYTKAHEAKRLRLENLRLLAEYEKDNEFMKVVHFFSKRKANNIIATSLNDFRDCQLQMKKNQTKYQDLYVKYQNTYNSILFSTYQDYYEERKPVVHVIEQMESLRPDANDDIEIFTNSRDFVVDWKKQNEIGLLSEVIDADYQKAVTIKEFIQEWQSGILSGQNYALNELIMESVDLVGATCIGINSQKRFTDLDFDVTIIDEAGQIQLHNALVPMSVSDKVIMLGDHKQIPPTLDSELEDACQKNDVDTRFLPQSLFEWLYNYVPERNRSMLDTQFRMPHEMADILSEQFYNNEYMSFGGSTTLTESKFPYISNRPLVIVDTSMEKDRYETAFEGEGCWNELEADAVHSILKRLVEQGTCELNEIGVISAYKKQVKLIREKITDIVSETDAKEMVASLDSFQGQERDVIIYSFTKSSNKPPIMNRVGFLKELRRLNVAMSRAKKMLVLIGDMNYLKDCRANEEEQEFAAFIRLLIQRVKEGYSEADRGYPEDSPVKGYGEYIFVKEMIERMENGYVQ